MSNMNKILVFSAITLVALLGLVSARNVMTGGAAGITGNAVKDIPSVSTGEYQEVSLSMNGFEYILDPPVLKKGVPVRMEVDLSTVDGCMRDIVIPAFGVYDYVKEGDNIIEFTPDESGTFNIACSMNMGRGTFDVVESDGTKSNYVETAKAAPAGSAGGCGCGGGAGGTCGGGF